MRRASPRRLLAVSLCVLALTWVPAATEAQIYRWTDAAGREHFTQDLSQVPPRHREAARAAAARPSARDPLQTYSTPTRPRPARGTGVRRGQHQIRFERHGTLMMVQVRLNDRVTAPFLADTGASGVSIPRSVAQQLGIRIDADTPTVMVGTANGTVVEPVVALDSVQVGTARVEGLRALVSSTMQVGLLGGAFFNNFVYQVDAAAGVMTLVPNDSVRGGFTRAQWQERFARVRGSIETIDARLDSGKDRRAGRIAALEESRRNLEGQLAELDAAADRAGVPQGWRN